MGTRSFLKWAGGKYALLDKIKEVLPKGDRLVEPFVGSGTVFVNTDYPKYLLSETNTDLINLYKLLKKEGNTFIDYCETLFVPENNIKEKFYELRSLFNATTDVRLKSALFIYLNKFGFNGLCRYNSSGGFNVPFGSRTTTYFPRKEIIHFLKKSKKAIIKQADFSVTMKSAKPGDVVYCDPPYVPLSDTSFFTSYSPGGFDMGQQEELANLAKQLQEKNIPVIISNHDTVLTRKLYKGAKISSFEVQRHISCDGKNRTKVKELLAVFS